MRSGNGIPAASAAHRASEVGTTRAAERVTLACRALSAAAEDLRLEHVRHKLEAIDDAANRLAAETERICELAEELVTLARALEPVGSQ